MTQQQGGFDMKNKSAVDFTQAASGYSETVDERRHEEIGQKGVDVWNFPKHLFIPEGAQAVDIRKLVEISAGSTAELMSFQAPKGAKVFFLGYAIFNDALDFDVVEFLPTVNNRRVFNFQGDPNDNYKIALGLGPDIGNNSLIPTQLQLNPEEVIRWQITNSDVVTVTMGVRMIGYVDTTSARENRRFGG